MPEVETIRRGLNSCLVGQTIQAIQIYRASLRWPIPQALLIQKTIGQTILDIQRRGKYLLLNCGTGEMLIHLGMSGQLLWEQTQTPPKRHDHVIWHFNQGGQLRLNDPRRFGALLWLETGKWQQHRLLANLGPEPLMAEWNANYIYTKIKNRRVSIKNWLMNANMVVGVGNIYASEALFLAKIHPNQPAGTLSQTHCEQLVQAVKQILSDAIEQGGTTLQDFRQSNGQPGYFAVRLQVYGRENQPCPRCTTPIANLKLNQRASFYCPHCQPITHNATPNPTQ